MPPVTPLAYALTPFRPTDWGFGKVATVAGLYIVGASFLAQTGVLQSPDHALSGVHKTWNFAKSLWGGNSFDVACQEFTDRTYYTHAKEDPTFGRFGGWRNEVRNTLWVGGILAGAAIFLKTVLKWVQDVPGAPALPLKKKLMWGGIVMGTYLGVRVLADFLGHEEAQEGVPEAEKKDFDLTKHTCRNLLFAEWTSNAVFALPLAISAKFSGYGGDALYQTIAHKLHRSPGGGLRGRLILGAIALGGLYFGAEALYRLATDTSSDRPWDTRIAVATSLVVAGALLFLIPSSRRFLARNFYKPASCVTKIRKEILYFNYFTRWAIFNGRNAGSRLGKIILGAAAATGITAGYRAVNDLKNNTSTDHFMDAYFSVIGSICVGGAILLAFPKSRSWLNLFSMNFAGYRLGHLVAKTIAGGSMTLLVNCSVRFIQGFRRREYFFMQAERAYYGPLPNRINQNIWNSFFPHIPLTVAAFTVPGDYTFYHPMEVKEQRHVVKDHLYRELAQRFRLAETEEKAHVYALQMKQEEANLLQAIRSKNLSLLSLDFRNPDYREEHLKEYNTAPALVQQYTMMQQHKYDYNITDEDLV